MRRILLVPLLLIIAIILWSSLRPTEARTRSKVVMIKVLDDTNMALNDFMYRNAAQVRQICHNRGWELYEYDWDGRDVNRFRRILRNLKDDWTPRSAAESFEFAFIVGGDAGYGHNHTAGPGTETENGYIRKLWEPDSTEISALPTFVWFSRAYSGEMASAGSRLYNCGLNHVGNAANRLLLSSNTKRYWAFHTQSTIADTAWVYSAKDNITFSGGSGDGATTVDTILTSANFPTDGTNNKEGFFALWSITGDIGQPFYFTGLQSGLFGVYVDAIACKHVKTFRPLAFTIDIDDWGKSYQFNGGSTRGVHTIKLNHDNFFANIDTLFNVIERYDLHLNIGTTANNLHGPYAATNQWAEWEALADKWKDSSYLSWVLHDHARESTADSVDQYFATINAYNKFFGKTSGPVTVARLDSMYSANCDSIEASYGVSIDHRYSIPPWDKLGGANDDLKDTIAVFLANRGLAIRAKYSELNTYLYKDTMWYRGAKFLNAIYLASDLDTVRLPLLTVGDEWGKAHVLYVAAIGPMFFMCEEMSGLNPQQDSLAIWDNYDTRGLEDYEYTGRTVRVLVTHHGPCYAAYGECRAVTLMKELGQLIGYLEELSGKDIYRCVSGSELATRYWEQIR